jgi:hypothetical protein
MYHSVRVKQVSTVSKLQNRYNYRNYMPHSEKLVYNRSFKLDGGGGGFKSIVLMGSHDKRVTRISRSIVYVVV